MVKISGQFDVVYWNYYPQPPQNEPIGSSTKKTLFLLGKVESNKFPEAEIWHPESIDAWYYVRIIGYVRISDNPVTWPQRSS